MGSGEVEDEFERLVDRSHLVESEVPRVFAQSGRIDGCDHLAHHACRLVAEHDLGMEAGGWSRGRRRAYDNRRKREKMSA